MGCVLVLAVSFAVLQQQRDTVLNDCMSHLPAAQSIAWQDSRGRGRFPSACREAKRSRDDAKDIQNYRDDLMKLYDAMPNPPATREIAQDEAEDIAMRMVEQTRRTSQEFKMVNSPFLNNILVNVGAKKGGQCYQWVRVLFTALPSKPYEAFERSWGGAHLDNIMENNSVIFTIRGQPLNEGILYDAWRGQGNPWWRKVSKDHYPWKVRFSEIQILSGEAQVMGIAEEAHPHNP